ncbi:MAG: carboxypeptidase regulatory-like domain-containing protein [Candidatus Brocadiae bacterium]|nr:carboxypeptidase regulatory-like domain-containing protein [Candidatus Brocadiia bacterium]
MKWYLKTYFFLFLFFASCLTIGWLIVQKQNISVSTPYIVGSIWDVANQAIPGIPVMLYPKSSGEEDCIYTSISNKGGKFYIPRAHPGIYYFTTIIDKERLVLQPFQVLKGTHLVEMKLIYAGTGESKKLVQETAPKTIPKPPETKTPEENPSENKGVLEGQVYLEKIPQESGFFSLSAQNLENPQYNPTLNISVERGFYKVYLPPGPYRLTANMQGIVSQGLEVFLLANQSTKMDLYFEKEIVSKKSGTDISITVIDASWTPQLGAQVILMKTEGNFQKEGETDENGEKIFTSIPEGEYQVKAIFNGLKGRCELIENVSIVEGKFISLVLRETD